MPEKIVLLLKGFCLKPFIIRQIIKITFDLIGPEADDERNKEKMSG